MGYINVLVKGDKKWFTLMCYKGYIIKIKGDKKATQNGK